MGSWDACCGISKLPIHDGDEVVDFLIGEVGSLQDRGFICYSNDLWTPVTIQTYGDYDDYGRIRPVPGWHLDYVTKMLKTHVVEQGENEYQDTPVKRSDIDFDLAQEAMHEGRLFLEAPSWVERKIGNAPGIPVTRMMVHRFVFDEIVSWGMHSWRGGTIHLDRLVEAGMEALTAFRKEQAEAPDDLQRDFNRLMRFEAARTDNIFLGPFRDREGGDLYVPHRFKDYLSLTENSDPADVQDIVTELSKFIILRDRMDEMRCLWTPQVGSQHNAYPELSKLYRVCDAYAQKQMRDYPDEDEEYVDFEDESDE